MLRLPAVLTSRYRLAAAREVHTWSFGQVKTIRRPAASGWEQCVGTLDDQRIFGPVRDFECACGKYWGADFRGMICDRCGVKVTVREERQRRFGHIDLPVSISHPLGDESELVAAVPVLPAVFFESSAGRDLGHAYEELVQAVTTESSADLVTDLRHLVDCLLPVVTLAHEWALAESLVLARGLVLESRDEPAERGATAGRRRE
jgi:hypothetical protein